MSEDEQRFSEPTLEKSEKISQQTSETNRSVRELATLVSTAPNADERIQKVRDEIAANPEKAAQVKQEIATRKQEHLHEVSLAQARLLHTIFTVVSKNPFITKTELIDKVKNTGDITNPKLTEELINTIEQMNIAMAEFKLNMVSPGMDEISQSKRGELFEQLVTESARKKTGLSYEQVSMLAKVSTEMEITRFGVVLFVNDPQAFSLIDPKTNVGGFFRKTQKFKKNSHILGFYQDEKPIIVPLIAVNGESMSVLEHEVGHSVANMLKQTLLGIKESHNSSEQPKSWTQSGVRAPETKVADIIWGSRIDLDEAKKAAEQLKEFENVRPTEERKKHENVLIEYSLQCAKDEILAEMSAEYGDITWHKGNLKKKQGLYDYFKNRLGVTVDSHLYERLWQAYEKKLDSYTKTSFSLHETYQERGEDSIWYKRIPLLRYVLLVNPIEKWESQLERLGYTEEIRQYNHLLDKVEQTARSMDRLSFLHMGHILRSKFFNTIGSQIQTIRFGLDKDILDTAEHSTLPLIREAQKQLDEVIAEFESSQEGSVLTEVTETSDTMIEIRLSLENISSTHPELKELCSYLQNELANIKILRKITKIPVDSLSGTSEGLRPILEKLRELKQVVLTVENAIERIKEIDSQFLQKFSYVDPARTVRVDRINRMDTHFAALEELKTRFLASLPRPFDAEEVIKKIHEYVEAQKQYVENMEKVTD